MSCAKPAWKPALAALLLGLAGAGALASDARASVLVFDDVAGAIAGDPQGTIPNGYGGFNWSSFGFIDGAVVHPGSGYENGTVSGSYVGFNEFANVATVSDTSFIFVGVYLTAAWNDGLNIQVEGLNGGIVLFDTGLSPLVVDTCPGTAPGLPCITPSPTFFNFGWTGIDELRFTASGGTNAGLGGSGAHFAMDDFTFETLPEPSATGLVAAGLLLLGALRSRVF